MQSAPADHAHVSRMAVEDSAPRSLRQLFPAKVASEAISVGVAVSVKLPVTPGFAVVASIV